MRAIDTYLLYFDSFFFSFCRKKKKTDSENVPRKVRALTAFSENTRSENENDGAGSSR